MAEEHDLSLEATERIFASKERLIRMLTGWMGSRDEAECVLQAGFARALEKGSVKSETSVVAWFATLVRNLAIDRLRRASVQRRVYSQWSEQRLASVPPVHEFEDDVCQCVSALLPTLPDSYREILDAVELRGLSVGEAGDALGVSPGNARVRLFRARKALKTRLFEVCGACAEHGCLDCACGSAGPLR